MNNQGKLWEIEACNFLRKKRYKLVSTNYTCRFGEIDLIMKKGKYLCFIEVKQRDEKSIATPAEFVGADKQKKMIATAQFYLAANPTKLQPRFDVVEVYTSDNQLKSIKHLENAFDLL